jgi:RNase adaptor protein for sRNA GlmZ degradation
MKVFVYSFSYLKTPLELFPLDNGGGYRFDCRCLKNPGRDGRHKELTGLDGVVIGELVSEDLVAQFMGHVMELVEISINAYRLKDYTSLSVGFGCTGGQHRSVYCAEWCFRHLREIGDLEVEVRHLQLETNAKPI